MDNNNAPAMVFHRKPLVTLSIWGVGVFGLLMGLNALLSRSGFAWFFFILPFGAALAALVEVRTVSFHDQYLSINYYLLRKRRIDYANIVYVAWEERRRRSRGVSVNYNVICLTLNQGKGLELAGFKEGDYVLFNELKAYAPSQSADILNVT